MRGFGSGTFLAVLLAPGVGFTVGTASLRWSALTGSQRFAVGLWFGWVLLFSGYVVAVRAGLTT